MSPLFALILGHLIGDFVLQTIDLVRYKGHSWKGLLLHTAIVVASCAVCLWSNLPAWWPWLIPMFLTHVVTDWAKVAINNRTTNWKTRLFFLDQLVHFGIIFLIVIVQSGGWPYRSLAEAIGAGSLNRPLFYFAAWIVAVFVVPLLEAQAAYALTRYVPRGTDSCGNSSDIAASVSDRLWGGFERTVVLLLVVVGPPAVWFAPLAFIPRIASLRAAWKHPCQARVYRIKIAISVLSMVVIGLVVWLAQPHLA